MTAPLLRVEGLAKHYQRGWPQRQTTFALDADFAIDGPGIVGVMGPNGSGKTTLFELITGSNQPSAGRVLVAGQDIHRVRYRERDRLAIHYHQSLPGAPLQAHAAGVPDAACTAARRRSCTCSTSRSSTRRTATSASCSTSSAGCARDGRLVFLCLHPNEPFHLDILREACERFIFVHNGALTYAASFAELARDERVRAYLGRLAPPMA